MDVKRRHGGNGEAPLKGDAADDWMNLVMTSGLFSMVVKKTFPMQGRKRFEERLGRLSANQVRLFGHILATAPNGVRVSQIAHDMDITPAAASQTVDRLVALGMLERAQDPNDRRASVITAAAEGRAFFKDVKTRSATLLEQVYSEIDASEEERAAFAAVLSRVRDALASRWRAYLDRKNQSSGL
jgi:DNA-binding MarR family transcriptional regulator